MKSKFSALWQGSTAIDTASLNRLMAIKQGIIEKIGCPAETTQINLIQASELSFSDVSGTPVSLSVIHFADAKNRRFVCLLEPTELRALHQMCETILNGSLDCGSSECQQ
ncbi:hypothetical protein [uncultured Parasutterella sp.]|uniref:hypothetical protein n=1 Tax=uncultured Parasutterella sp. TaxID=1263098 RepID=UPI002590EA4E|nr:hypothetical protein [uncultured Parasutterella sp.]